MRPAIERLIERIEFDPNGGCWLWSGSPTPGGYSQVQVGTRRGQQRPHSGHRISYEHFKGPVPEGMVVRHKCDVRLCVNPDHLEIGTRRDNVQDAKDRGRHAKGEDFRRAKLNERSVKEIRLRYAAGETQPALAKEFGVTQSAVNAVCQRKTWAHV